METENVVLTFVGVKKEDVAKLAQLLLDLAMDEKLSEIEFNLFQLQTK